MGAAIVKDEMFVAYNRTPGGQLNCLAPTPA
jgi:hypothetical protein